MHEHIVIVLAGIGLLAIACQWLAWRVQLPAILFLLLAGILAGPVTGFFDPDAVFGELLFPLVSMAVAVILFEGSLTLRMHEIRGLERVVRNLVTIGILVNWAVTAAAAHWIVGISWQLAVLFGAVMVVTGPTVIVPMLRTVRPTAKIGNILRWEGILIDSVGAVLAVLVFEFLISSGAGRALSQTTWALAKLVVVGTAFGAAAGYALGVILRRGWLPEYLHNLATLGLVFTVFAAANAMQEEAGLVAVTAMGFLLANMRDVKIDEILDFKESLSILLISGLFIILAARMDFALIEQLGWAAVLLFLMMQFVARPLKVFVSTLGSRLKWQERAMIAWIGPRGIVAAAISAIFALRLEGLGMAQAELLVPLAFVIIIGTVLFSSATAGWMAKLLKVQEPEPKGLLIVGANVVARAIGKALAERGFPVLLTDTYWDNVRLARMEGLNAYYGSPVSEHADRHLDLVGLGRLLGLAPQAELNALAAVHFSREFGQNRVYALQSDAEKDAPERLQLTRPHAGYVLFGKEVTYARLARLLSGGAEIRATKLSPDFSFDQWRAQAGASAIPLFAIDPKDRLEVFVEGGKLELGEGWTLLSLNGEGA